MSAGVPSPGSILCTKRDDRLNAGRRSDRRKADIPHVFRH